MRDGRAIAVQIADVLASLAYAGPFASGAVVRRAYTPHKKLEQLGSLHITVIPVAWSEEDDTRDGDRDEVTCAVCFQCRVESPDARDDIDELLRVFEINVNMLRDWSGDPLAGLHVVAINAQPEALWDTDDLNQNSVVTSVATVTASYSRDRT